MKIAPVLTFYLCIVVTNQPVISQEEVIVDTTNETHNKMETLLGVEATISTGFIIARVIPIKDMRERYRN